MDDTRPEVAVLSREPGYAFDNAWEEARRRLGLLEEVPTRSGTWKASVSGPGGGAARWFPGFAVVSAWGRRPSPPEVSPR